MPEEHLLYSIEKNVARLTINREAQRNAISLEAIDLFSQCLDEAEKDEKVRAMDPVIKPFAREQIWVVPLTAKFSRDLKAMLS
jgi:hypothetical protein